MTTGLPVSRLINIAATLTPSGATYANIDTLLILGDSAVIDTTTRIATFNTLAAVAATFGTTAPEYLAAGLFFGQSPQPTLLFIGRWARTATAGALYGAPLTTAQMLLTNFTAVSSGGFHITVNGGTSTNVPAINLSGASSLSGVAALISAALTTAALAVTCVWTGTQFNFVSTTTGTASSVSFLTAPTSGTDISGLLGGTVASGGYVVAGIAAETALAAVQALDNVSTYWYGLTFAASTMPADADYTAIAGYIQGTSHLFGLTTGEASAINSSSTADIASVLAALSYTRTFCQYSTQNPYAVTSIFGYLVTTDFNGSNTMPSVAYKTEPGVTPEPLSQNSATILDGKRYSYFAPFANGTSILVNATCAGPAYIDEIFGIDWLQNRIQTDIFNLFASVTKVPQTDAGVNMIVTTIEHSLGAAVKNGFVAPGQWNATGFGQIATGAYLPKGYQVYAPPISTQSQTARATRAAPAIQAGIKLAGAIASANILLSVNR